ncbi:MAG: c-type cytochrome [Acidimicrobiales bacterium]
MTEIPEHLLKRSRERRAALGLGGGESAAPAESGGVTESPSDAPPAAPVPAAAAATPAPVEEAKPEPPKPVPAYIQAGRQRRRVPYWAMPVLAALPLWAYVYVGTLEPPPVENDPIELGSGVYSNAGCAGCHGGDGSGSAAVPGFVDQAVIETWPDPIDQMVWVRLGSEGWPGDTYGDTDKPKQGGMPQHASLSDEELAQVVLYERRVLGGEEIDVTPEEDVLAQIALGELTFAEAFAEADHAPIAKEAGVTEEDLAGA